MISEQQWQRIHTPDKTACQPFRTLQINESAYTRWGWASNFLIDVISKECKFVCEWKDGFKYQPDDSYNVRVTRLQDGFHVYLPQDTRFPCWRFLPPRETRFESLRALWKRVPRTSHTTPVWIHSGYDSLLAGPQVPICHQPRYAALQHAWEDMQWTLHEAILTCLQSFCSKEAARQIMTYFWNYEPQIFVINSSDIYRDPKTGRCFADLCCNVLPFRRYETVLSLARYGMSLVVLQHGRFQVTCHKSAALRIQHKRRGTMTQWLPVDDIAIL